MPRKAAAAADGETPAAGEPRRSSRIKDLPKVDAAPKKVAKPRAKKEAKEGEEGVKPKRGRKRKEPDTNGDDAEDLPAKKAKPASKAAPASKPASKATSKPASKVAKPASKAAKPASKAAAGSKPASKASVKPASRAGSKKPASKADAAPASAAPNVGETIAEEAEAEAEAEAAAEAEGEAATSRPPPPPFLIASHAHPPRPPNIISRQRRLPILSSSALPNSPTPQSLFILQSSILIVLALAFVYTYSLRGLHRFYGYDYALLVLYLYLADALCFLRCAALLPVGLPSCLSVATTTLLLPRSPSHNARCTTPALIPYTDPSYCAHDTAPDGATSRAHYKMSPSPSTSAPPARRSALTTREARALLQAHIFHSGDADRTPCLLTPAYYDHAARDTSMRRTFHHIPELPRAPVQGSPDVAIRNLGRRYSYPPFPPSKYEPLW
ncbi:hypothetical protein B0H15DRAFT_1018125 [Mycena belliarum]|uniref:Uncharacterized protein n=1 Tax=Mycena belliarum TaxID=1033014 RepID=A0AAD6UHR7_9AGAR|nr:hypothetical protein B0H15DRAFT_1018125 [Mycena belliae]